MFVNLVGLITCGTHISLSMPVQEVSPRLSVSGGKTLEHTPISLFLCGTRVQASYVKLRLEQRATDGAAPLGGGAVGANAMPPVPPDTYLTFELPGSDPGSEALPESLTLGELCQRTPVKGGAAAAAVAAGGAPPERNVTLLYRLRFRAP